MPSHRIPSSHIESQGVWLQVPVATSQVSVVHAMPSSQGTLVGVCSQPTPTTQVSTVQMFPSLQSASLGACAQPVGPQVSVVQAMPSSQSALSGV